MVAKSRTHLSKTAAFKPASMYVILLPFGMTGLKIVAIWSLVLCGFFHWSESTNELAANSWNHVLLLLWFGSYEQLRNNAHGICDSQFAWYRFYVRPHILYCITRSKILPKLQIILKLPAVKCWGCLSVLPGTEFEGSVDQWSSLECHVWNLSEGFCYFDCNIFYFGQ